MHVYYYYYYEVYVDDTVCEVYDGCSTTHKADHIDRVLTVLTANDATTDTRHTSSSQSHNTQYTGTEWIDKTPSNAIPIE